MLNAVIMPQFCLLSTLNADYESCSRQRYLQLIGVIFFAAFFNTHLSSQVMTPDYILGGIHDSVKKFTVPKGKDMLVLECGFNKSNFDLGLLDSIRNSSIDTIMLVYTAFRQAETFNQSDLNVVRLNALRQKLPYLFDNNLIHWKVIRQTGARDDQEAKSFFHGFVIKMRRNALVPPLSTDKEIDFMKSYLRSLHGFGPFDTIPAEIVDDIDPEIRYDVFTRTDTLIRFPNSKRKLSFIDINYLKKDYRKAKSYAKAALNLKPLERERLTSILLDTNAVKLKYKPLYYHPVLKRKRERGILYTRRTILKRKLAKDTLYLRTREFYTGISAGTSPVYLYARHLTLLPGKFANYNFPDSVVTVTLKNMNNHASNVLVEDVTGSMYPYILQTFLWRRLYISKAHLSHFVFFNDGDHTPDRLKVIGNTRGIYSLTTDSIPQVEALVFQAMMNGDGGDGPENNIEALIYAQEKFPDKNLVMVADNNALVKDISLLDKIKKPVHIILCGTYNGVMASYVMIAAKTGGTISTIEKTYSDLKNLKEGEKMNIGGQIFLMTRTGLQVVR